MSTYRYTLLDPTGNITALVTEPAAAEDEAQLTRELLKQSEQVAYLGGPVREGAEASIRMMGGEFCGNAAMAAASWLARNRLKPGEETVVRLDVSGTEKTTDCRIRALEDGFEGTVLMPRILETGETAVEGHRLTAVRMEGILHLVLRGEELSREDAEALLARAAGEMPGEEAVGLLQWDGRSLKPLVYVRGSGSMVWERGCGSGSAAVGALEALWTGEGVTVTDVEQPGGTIRVTAEVRDGRAAAVRITGRVRLGAENEVQVKNRTDP